MNYIEYYKDERAKSLKNAKTKEQVDFINSFYDNCLKQIKNIK